MSREKSKQSQIQCVYEERFQLALSQETFTNQECLLLKQLQDDFPSFSYEVLVSIFLRCGKLEQDTREMLQYASEAIERYHVPVQKVSRFTIGRLLRT